MEKIDGSLRIIYGEDDDVTPLENSREFYHVLNDKSRDGHQRRKGMLRKIAQQNSSAMHRLEILETTGHQDVVTNSCLGKGRAQATILNWIDSIVDLPLASLGM